ncbi:WD40-repeat-containing domain protein [Lipomyces kononenkoae]|uniref:WD40-repeat-containing domain protein n=1 Tax=Lipomyces kononenkoae TaxID=34357 RepID=A0ACC3T978_LIPKO
MSISSKELNYLIWRYLQESGFSHSTYAFQHETEADRLDEKYGPVTPMGLLVSVFQKGLHYMEIESVLNPDGTERQNPEPFSLFSCEVATSLNVRPDGIEHESSNTVDVSMTNAKEEDVKESHDSTEKLENAIAETTKATDTAIERLSSPARRNRAEQPSRQPSPGTRDGPSAGEPKRVKISHKRADSVAMTDIFQSPEAAAKSISVESKSERLTSKNQVIPLPEVNSANDCTWSSDGSHLAISTFASEVFVYTLSTTALSPRSPRKVKLASSHEISTVALTSLLLAIGTYLGTIELWAISEKVPAHIATLSGFHSAPVLSIEFTMIDGKMALVSIDCLRKAGIWDVSGKGSFWFSLVPSSAVDMSHNEDESIKDAISDVKILSDRKSVATTTGKSGTLDIFDLASAPKNGKLSCAYRLNGHTKGVNVLYYSPSSEKSAETFISGSEDNSIRIWDLVSKSAKYVLEGHNTGVMALNMGTYEMVGKRKRIQILASGDFAGRLRLWDLDTGAMIAKVEYSYPIFAFGLVGGAADKKANSNGDGSSSSQQQRITLLTGSKDGVVNMWDVDEIGTGHRMSSRPLEEGLGGITGVAVCESNTYGQSISIVAGRTRSCLCII